jgi:thioredoxin reductase
MSANSLASVIIGGGVVAASAAFYYLLNTKNTKNGILNNLIITLKN